MSPDVFLDVLRDDPGDDTTRLVYADWLDDQGDSARAEFIRLFVQARSRPIEEKHLPLLGEPINALFHSHKEEWIGPRPLSLEKITWRGGLVHGLEFGSNAQIADIEPLLRRHPVRELTLHGIGGLLELARCAALESVRSLRVHQIHKGSASALDCLLGSPFLRLEHLSLSGDAVDDYLARFMARCPGLKRLRGLELHSNVLSDAGLVQLLRPGVLRLLEEWDVEAPRATRIGMNNLLMPHRAARWTGLTWGRHLPMHWSHTAVSQSCVWFTGCSSLRRLVVYLQDCPASYEVPLLRGLGSLTHLRELTIHGPIRRKDAEKMAAWPGLERLESFQIAYYWSQPEAERDEVKRILTASPHRNAATRWVV
jgi:uncharacterized protein (TIGR02996 family)